MENERELLFKILHFLKKIERNTTAIKWFAGILMFLFFVMFLYFVMPTIINPATY